MTEELNNNTAPETVEAVETVTPSPAKKKKKLPVILGVVVVVLIAAGAGFWVWHEQPSFCNAICHTPMDPDYETYEQEPGEAGTDKWGNAVSDVSAMGAAWHRAKLGTSCMDCHVPTFSEQVSEGIGWVTGNYEVYENKTYGLVLDERSAADLVEARGLTEDEFCLNEACHNYTRDILIARTAQYEPNPHAPQHGVTSCTDCHKAHRASVLTCAACHTKYDLPAGWITPSQQKKLDMPA